jgi:hypothetical protein
MQKVVLLFCTEPQINDTLDPTTMLSLKTTIAALIAALSVIATASVAGAFIPQAFAQNFDDNGDNGGTTVTANQSNSATFNIGQSQSQSAGGTDDAGATDNNDGNDDDGTDTTTTQTASQGFCLQSNQQNAAAGNDATNTGVNAIVANNQSSVNCS